jgi:preprotein translocase subunit SecG
MVTFLVIVFILTCFLMIVVILLQAGKGRGLAGTFGGIGSSAVFGGRGAATFLSKTTTILAVLYMSLCLVIGYFYKQRNQEERESLIQRQATEQSTLPATDVPVAPIEQPAAGDSVR